MVLVLTQMILLYLLLVSTQEGCYLTEKYAKNMQ